MGDLMATKAKLNRSLSNLEAIVLVLILIDAGAIAYFCLFRLNQVKIQVTYKGKWASMYMADLYGSPKTFTEWTGTGNSTVVINRPSIVSPWIVQVIVQGFSRSRDLALLTVSILNMYGTVLATKSSYGILDYGLNVDNLTMLPYESISP